MKQVRIVSRFLAAICIGVALLAQNAYAGETFMTLKENIFVCISPQVYDDAMARVRELNGGNLASLRKELAETNQCMYVDHEMADSIMAPYAIVMDRNGTKVQVQFVVTFRQRIELLHRLMNRFVLVGWTDESNLEEKQIL